MNKKIKKDGFTLIELLVVVTLVSIIASIGVFAYSKFVENGKAAATKEIHKQYVSYVKSEVLRCRLGEKRIFPTVRRPAPDGLLNCHQRSASNIEGFSVAHFYEAGFKNPYNNKTAVRSSAPWYFGGWCDADVGYINTNSLFQNKDLYVHTCFKVPCNNNKNILISTIKEM